MANYTVDRKKWAKLSIFEQMGNIYSEVGRSFAASNRQDADTTKAATVRAIDLFDATTEVLLAAKSPRLREVLRAKDQYLGALFGDQSLANRQSLEAYFMPYAIAARRFK
jgi:hypothetical protein